MAIFVNNLIIYTGTDFDQTFTLQNNNDLSPLDLSDYTGCADIKKHEGSLTKISFNIEYPNRLLGQIKISLSSTTTASIKPGNYIYDLFVKNSNDTIKVVEGKVFVKQSVTRI